MTPVECVGINGGGRMGKGLLRYLIAQKMFPKIVINFGREVGRGLEDVIEYIKNDTIYGSIGNFALGMASSDNMDIMIVDENKGLIKMNGVSIRVLQQERNPKDINWGEAEVVVDTTGKYNYPNKNTNVPGGSVRGHFATSSVKKVLVSSPFKDVELEMVDDSIMLVRGINDSEYNAAKHNIISAASCTTTCLAHAMKPLLRVIDSKDFLAVVLTTVHASTGKQPHTDRVPANGAGDLVTSRSARGNIFLSTTGAVKALPGVMPEVINAQYSAESVRIDSPTSSLVILTLDFKSEGALKNANADDVNRLLKETAEGDINKHLWYFDQQSVATDAIGTKAAAIIIGSETDFMPIRCGEIEYNKLRLYGWYDNEFGYVHMLVELLKKIVAEL